MAAQTLLTIGETLYTKFHGNILLQNLADGTPGPAVGIVDTSGSVTLDEELAAGEWVGELLTATTIRREALLNWPSVPASILESIRNGGASQWCDVMDAASVARCRAAVEQLGPMRQVPVVGQAVLAGVLAHGRDHQTVVQAQGATRGVKCKR